MVLAFLYRQYKALAKQMNWQTEQCYQTNRGADLPPILSCEGMQLSCKHLRILPNAGNGNAFYFYVNGVFFMAGTLAFTLVLYGAAMRYLHYLVEA